jgi:nicotinate phosphoribosyltransferase
MQNAVIKHFPRAKVRYEFINRGNTPFPDGFAEQLRKHIYSMSELRLTVDEKKYLESNLLYLDPTYIDFLSGYCFNPGEVGVVQKGGELIVSIEGYWYRTILWEVPLMAMISELYFKMTNEPIFDEKKIIDIVQNKAETYKLLGAKVADFGSRRRYSFENHDRVVKTLKSYGGTSFTGTSNVYFAFNYKLTAIGTHAHEWFMFHAAKYGYKIANKTALENWVKTYRGDLGIALSDTFTSDVFFQAFDTKFAKLFDGVRHDSGDPIVFADKTIEHYKKLKIDPLAKVIVFSDGLNPEEIERIEKHCRGKIKSSYGVGTNFTNDVGVKPLNIVIKITQVKPEGHDWEHAVKLSDSPGKHTGDAEAVNLCKKVLHI